MVKDTVVNEHNGTFTDWHLKLWGESIDADKATVLPMPQETDDDNHADIITTTTISGTTQSITPVATPTSLTANPTDHPDRPINAKPSGTDDETSPVSETSSPSASATAASSWLPSFFPTLGVGPKTQLWIYGSLGLIVLFCGGLAVYFYLARRKRLLNNPRDEWEFDLLEEDEADGLAGGRKKGGKRRAGELYDAFAAGSEDEDGDAFSDLSEGEEEARKHGYRDEGKESRHVIGDDDDDESDVEGGNEKLEQREKLIGSGGK